MVCFLPSTPIELKNWALYELDGRRVLYVEPERPDTHRRWLIFDPPAWLVDPAVEPEKPSLEIWKFLNDVLKTRPVHGGVLKLFRFHVSEQFAEMVAAYQYDEFTLVTPQLLGYFVEDFFILDADENSVWLCQLCARTDAFYSDGVLAIRFGDEELVERAVVEEVSERVLV